MLTSPAVRAAVLLFGGGLLGAVLVGALPAQQAVQIGLVAVIAVASVAAARGALADFGRFERRRGRPAAPARLAALLDSAERRLELASDVGVQFEDLRRGLVEVAEQRLAGHGLRLESEAARRLLGEEAWLLLARPRAVDKFAPGPRPAELNGLVTALERL